MVRPTSLLIILIISVLGYFYLKATPKTAAKLGRTEGYHTFLWSVGEGMGLFVRGYILYLFHKVVCAYIGWESSLSHDLFVSITGLELDKTDEILADIIILTAILSYIAPRLQYGFSQEKYKQKLYDWFAEDRAAPEFNQLIFKSFKYGLPILFTLSDRKVFIGYVTEIHPSDFSDIQVVPLYSGYREESTLELNLLTPYVGIIEDIENIETEDVELEEFLVTLPLREIVHAHLFNFEYMDSFAQLKGKE